MDTARRRDSDFDFLTATEPRNRSHHRRSFGARGWVATIASTLFIVLSGWINVHSISSSRLLGAAHGKLYEVPALGFAMIWQAHKDQPLARGPKREMAVAVSVLGQRGLFESGLADRMHQLAMSVGPWAPITLFSRVEHLMLAQRWEEKTEEIEEILARLKTMARLQPATWIAEARFAILIEDFPRAIGAIQAGLALQAEGLELAALESLNDLIVRN